MQNVISFNYKKGTVELVSRVNNGRDELSFNILGGYGALIACGETVATVTSSNFMFVINDGNLVGDDTLNVTIQGRSGYYSFQIKKTKNLKGVYLNQVSEFVYELSNQTEDGSDYAKLKDKPSINGITLEGNKTSSQLGLMPAGVDFVTHPELDAGLNRKQNKLYAGKNIKLDQSGLISSDASIVEANPSGQAVMEINTISINGVVYSLPTGSGTTAINTRLILPLGQSSTSREGSVIE